MSDPAEVAVQKALFDLWVADAGVHALVADRIHDRPPPEPTFPYVSFGPVQTLDREECAASVEVALQIDVWSRAVGSVEAKRIAAVLRDAVRTANAAGSLTLPGWHLPIIRFRDTRVMRDPDGLTTHAVVTLECHLDPGA